MPIRKIILLIIFLFVFLYPIPYIQHPTHAQTPCGTAGAGSSPRAQGLVSSPEFSATNKFYTSTSGSGCVIDPKAAFAPEEVPTYETLKSLYFDRSKSTRISTYTGDANQGNITTLVNSTDTDRLIYVNGSLTISGNGFLNGKPNIPIIIFIQNNLTINSRDIDFGRNSSSAGLVFIVKGDVNISQNTTSLDAIVISEGTICTAYDGGSCPTTNVDNSSPLTINGSLISLKQPLPADPNASYIKFKRSLADNNNPAEIINHQVKYLVILRNLISGTYQRWSEIL